MHRSCHARSRTGFGILEIEIGYFVLFFLREGPEGDSQGLMLTGCFFKGIGVQVAIFVKPKIQPDVRAALAPGGMFSMMRLPM
jgi:hypothetical protein